MIRKIPSHIELKIIEYTGYCLKCDVYDDHLEGYCTMCGDYVCKYTLVVKYNSKLICNKCMKEVVKTQPHCLFELSNQILR